VADLKITKSRLDLLRAVGRGEVAYRSPIRRPAYYWRQSEDFAGRVTAAMRTLDRLELTRVPAAGWGEGRFLCVVQLTDAGREVLAQAEAQP